jgi:flavorubredoxin
MVREIADGVHWLQSCSTADFATREDDFRSDPPDWYKPGEDVHLSSCAYLIVGDDETLLFDTLPPQDRSLLFDELETVLGERPLDYVVPSHHEMPHGGNTNAILEHYPDATLMTSKYGRGHELYYMSDSIQVGEGDEIDLGGQTVAFHKATFPDTAIHMWMSELTSNTLFCVDWLGFPHMSSDCETFVEEMDRELTVEQLEEYHGLGMVWLSLVDPERVNAAIDAEIEKHEPEILAPTHGNVMVGDAVHYMDLMKTVVNHFAVEGIPPEIAL